MIDELIFVGIDNMIGNKIYFINHADRVFVIQILWVTSRVIFHSRFAESWTDCRHWRIACYNIGYM